MCVWTHVSVIVMRPRRTGMGDGGNTSLHKVSEKVPGTIVLENVSAFLQPSTLTFPHQTYPGLRHVSLPVELLKGMVIFQLQLPGSDRPGQRWCLCFQSLYLGGNLLLVPTFLLQCRRWKEEERGRGQKSEFFGIVKNLSPPSFKNI